MIPDLITAGFEYVEVFPHEEVCAMNESLNQIDALEWIQVTATSSTLGSEMKSNSHSVL